MTDLALMWNPDRGEADLVLQGAVLVTNGGLHSAVLISLFTDRRAAVDDRLPAPSADRRGWWGDVASAKAGDQLGSKLWLLSREKELTSVLRSAEDAARAALAWLKDDGIAGEIVAVATNPLRGVLALNITISRPDGTLALNDEFVWRNL